MKSCLKLSPASSASTSTSTSTNSPSSSRQNAPAKSRPCASRTVSFRDKEEFEVHLADEWDRSPVDIARKLSYDDILELKEMQVAAARACARAHAANGSTSRYLSNVPLALLPLLPESGHTAPPTTPTVSPPHTPEEEPGAGGVGVTLAEACLCKVFSADTGVPSTEGKAVAEDAYGHRQSCAHHANGAGQFSSNSTSAPTPAYQHYQAPFKLNVQHQIPSPPDTPPRVLLTSIPPPPPTARARNFSFLPLLDASSSSSSPVSTPGATSPPLSPRVSSPTRSPTYPMSSFSSAASAASSSSSSPSGPSTPGKSSAYSAYNPYAGFRGVGGSATLGLERKMGFASSDSESESESNADSDSDEEENDWRNGLRPCSSNSKASSSSKAPSIPTLPPSPPAENSALPSTSTLSHPLPLVPVNPTLTSALPINGTGSSPRINTPVSAETAKPISSLRLSTSPTKHSRPRPPSPKSPMLPLSDRGSPGEAGTKMNTGARKTIPLVMLA